MRNPFKRILNKPNWHNLRSTKPISRVFAFDRGTPIDRIYIEHFLESNKDYIHGTLCEIADNSYSKKYGHNVNKFEIFHNNENPNATIVGDLSNISTLPENKPRHIVFCSII